MRFGLIALLFMITVGHASEKGENVKYVPPPGFQGHKWGEVRAAFHRLPAEPIGVGAAWMRIQEKQLGATDGVVLHPVIYQFCANWRGKRDKRTPPNFDDLNRFCGMKFRFKTEIGEELRKLPRDQLTAQDRVLATLIELYGRPKGFSRRGKVLIDTAEDAAIDAEIRRFNTWRWCPAVDEGLHTDCTASVTLSLDPVTGMATVLYSTPKLWEFAFARENYGFKGDSLFKALHALD